MTREQIKFAAARLRCDAGTLRNYALERVGEIVLAALEYSERGPRDEVALEKLEASMRDLT